MDESLQASRYLTALCLYREARGASQAAKAAVLAVIRNRATDARRRWPTDELKVIIQPYQFSSFNLNDPNTRKFPIPGDVEWKAWLDCLAVVDAGLTADPTGGACFYHDKSILPPAKSWLGKNATVDDLLKYKTVDIGPFSFYRF